MQNKFDHQRTSNAPYAKSAMSTWLPIDMEILPLSSSENESSWSESAWTAVTKSLTPGTLITNRVTRRLNPVNKLFIACYCHSTQNNSLDRSLKRSYGWILFDRQSFQRLLFGFWIGPNRESETCVHRGYQSTCNLKRVRDLFECLMSIEYRCSYNSFYDSALTYILAFVHIRLVERVPNSPRMVKWNWSWIVLTYRRSVLAIWFFNTLTLDSPRIISGLVIKRCKLKPVWGDFSCSCLEVIGRLKPVKTFRMRISRRVDPMNFFKFVCRFY